MAALLMAYFLSALPNREGEALYYATSADGLRWQTLNGGPGAQRAVLTPTANSSSLRDPFIDLGADGLYHLVATNGIGFGDTPTILTYSSPDLITWSPETIVDVMPASALPPGATITDLWAPEWIWDPVARQYVVFFAVAGTGIAPTQGCVAGALPNRFVFWAAYTADFVTFAAPFIMADPGCAVVGMGGIDGDIKVAATGGVPTLFYKDARGSGEPVRGIRAMLSSSGRVAGPYNTSTISPLLVPTLVEAPEVVRQLDGSTHLYFDCSFFPTPPGWPRPPFGVARAEAWSPGSYPFVTLEGSCTGNDTAVVSFPPGTTHGSFVPLSAAQLAALQAAFPS